MPQTTLSHGQIHYRDEGTGRPVLLVHGLLVDGTVWERMLPLLCPHARCIVPDLPLGSHRRAMRPDADLSPPGVAALLAELMDRLELEDVTLVGNDTGGAICQLVVAAHRDRIGRLVLTNCDAYEQFPPPKLRPVVSALGRVPAVVAGLGALGRLRSARRLALAAAPLTVEPIPDELVRRWVEPLRDRDIRRDLVKVARDISPQHTLAAAEHFADFPGPVTVAWGMRDAFFEVGLAERLAAAFRESRLEKLENARTFVQMDMPEEVARLILEVA